MQENAFICPFNRRYLIKHLRCDIEKRRMLVNRQRQVDGVGIIKPSAVFLLVLRRIAIEQFIQSFFLHFAHLTL